MRLSIALAAVAAIISATPASAGFVNNRPIWNALSDQQKSGFVMAVIDNMMIADITSPYATADSRAILACFNENSLTDGDLIELVDKGYEDPATWTSPAFGILYSAVLTKVCPYYVNRERTIDGLEYKVGPDAKPWVAPSE